MSMPLQGAELDAAITTSIATLKATFGEQGRFLGQRAQNLGQPTVLGIALVGLEVAQHPVQHQVLVAGMADADPDPSEFVADSDDRDVVGHRHGSLRVFRVPSGTAPGEA